MTIGIGSLMAATAYSLQIPEVPIKLLTPTAKMPQYMTEGAAAIDLFVDWIGTRVDGAVYRHPDGTATIYPDMTSPVIVGFGIAMAIPRGWCGRMVPRSSGERDGLWLRAGLIDSDYRGEVMCVVTGASHLAHGTRMCVGDRIAQMFFTPAPRATLRSVAELPPTIRGAGGFGSTGA